MATATATHVEKKVVTNKLVKVVTLTLTEEEAKALGDVTYKIGGDPKTSRRRHFDAIRKALIAVVGYRTNTNDFNRVQNSIYFEDEPPVEVKA